MFEFEFGFGFGFEIEYVLISAVALVIYLIVGELLFIKNKTNKKQ